MENLLGLLRIHIHRGVNLAIRDVRSSDPYVIVQMGKQMPFLWQVNQKNISQGAPQSLSDGTFVVPWTNLSSKVKNKKKLLERIANLKLAQEKLKTRVVKKNVNPEWNEDLTLSIADPNLPIKLSVYDKDTFTPDDKMGDAEFDIKPFIEAVKLQLEGIPSSTIIKVIKPTRENCLAEESCIIWADGKVVQNMFLRLRNVERGEVELQLQWIEIPGSRGL